MADRTGDDDAAAHWEARYQGRAVADTRAAEVLAWHSHLLPRAGVALDMACGLGANACLLARLGLETHAWDIAESALDALRTRAQSAELAIATERRNVETRPPEPGRFDAIVVSAFLHRPMCPAIAAALRPGGLLFYQTYCRERVGVAGPRNPDYLLEPGELLRLFPELAVVVYREEGRIGDPVQGFRDRAMFIGRRDPISG